MLLKVYADFTVELLHKSQCLRQPHGNSAWKNYFLVPLHKSQCLQLPTGTMLDSTCLPLFCPRQCEDNHGPRAWDSVPNKNSVKILLSSMYFIWDLRTLEKANGSFNDPRGLYELSILKDLMVVITIKSELLEAPQMFICFLWIECCTLSNMDGRKGKKYRGMGSLEAMTKGSDARYLGNKEKLKIAQGVVGAVADKGSVLKFIPYTMQAVKQGLQDLGASSLHSAHNLIRSDAIRLEGLHKLKEAFMAIMGIMGNLYSRQYLLLPGQIYEIPRVQNLESIVVFLVGFRIIVQWLS